MARRSFRGLLQELADAWNRGNADKAAALFTPGAIYTEPPGQQRYVGRDAIRAYFDETFRVAPPFMEWHTMAIDGQSGRGFAEYSFTWNGRIYHGVVVLRVVDGLISNWREYQVRTEIPWEQFTRDNWF